MGSLKGLHPQPQDSDQVYDVPVNCSNYLAAYLSLWSDTCGSRRSGLMLLLSTNLLLWLNAVTEDTVHMEIELEKQNQVIANGSLVDNTTAGLEYGMGSNGKTTARSSCSADHCHCMSITQCQDIISESDFGKTCSLKNHCYAQTYVFLVVTLPGRRVYKNGTIHFI